MKKPGSFVVSLDFELMWGMFDKVTAEQYGAHVRGVWEVVPELLTLFERYGIHATWAVVGMLTFESKSQFEAALPPMLPQYTKSSLSAYQHLDTAAIDETDPLYFAPQLVQRIVATPGQELASHTFSHYYCREEQVGGESGEAAFAADCAAFQTAISRFHQSPTSIIFPRNQWSKPALTTLAGRGYTAFRGTEDHFLYRARTDTSQTNLVIRALRLLDHYFNLSGFHTYKARRSVQAGLTNLPASRFLRPHNPKLTLFEPIRLRRITHAMTHAAKHGEVFHLWWHPHNFGINQAENFAFLIKILEHFKQLEEQYGMESHSMCELVIPGRE